MRRQFFVSRMVIVCTCKQYGGKENYMLKLKKAASVIAATVMTVTFVLNSSVYAYPSETDLTYEYLKYKIVDNAVIITDCDADTVIADVPAKIEGLPVTEISEGAFSFKENLKEIKLPDTITKIDDRAFEGSALIENFIMPDSVTSIGSKLFLDCENLKKVQLSKNLNYLKDDMFMGTALEEINLENIATNIPSLFFKGQIL